jgi:hypothetical protein
MPAPVLFQPAAAVRFQRSVDTIVGALRPTLGPRPRLVAIDTGISGKPPELLDSGALIARRAALHCGRRRHHHRAAGVDRGLDLLPGQLEAMRRPIAGQPQLTRLAESLLR